VSIVANEPPPEILRFAGQPGFCPALWHNSLNEYFSSLAGDCNPPTPSLDGASGSGNMQRTGEGL